MQVVLFFLSALFNFLITTNVIKIHKIFNIFLNVQKTYTQKEESNATQVSVTGLELDAGGRYSCEVSADAPSFHTAIVSADMNVVGKLYTYNHTLRNDRKSFKLGIRSLILR